MRTRDRKRALQINANYCAKCYVRLGVGEPNLVKNGKSYHPHCYAKHLATMASRNNAESNPL
jgi:hypothetical protein